MLRTILAATLLCALTAEAYPGQHRDCGIVMPCAKPSASTPDQARVTRGRWIAREMGFGAAIERRAVRAPKARQTP